MITLATLGTATEQEVFDQVATHLLKQNKKSLKLVEGRDYCFYRGSHNLKCAAGCLIGEAEYESWMENKIWQIIVSALSDQYMNPMNHCDLIRSLQEIHDNYDVNEWISRLELIAVNYNLNNKVLKHNRECL